MDVATGDVYVIDNAHDAVDKFDASGAYIGQITGRSTANGTFGFGAGSENVVAVDNSARATQGNVYVVSEAPSGGGAGKAIFAFNSSGTELWERPGFNGVNTDTCGVSVDPNGNPWVSDYNGQVVQEFNAADGSLGSRALNTSAQGTNPCETAFDSAGNLYVDSWHSRLDKYNANFGFVATLDPGPVLDVATDLLTGDVYAVNSPDGGATWQIAEWDSSGNAVSGTPFDTGSTSLTGVAIDGTLGRRMGYVSDTSANDIQMWDLAAPPPTVNVTPPPLNISQTGATLTGTVNPNGSNVTDCHFNYGPTLAYGLQAPCRTLPGAGTTPVAVSADVTGLTANRTYHYQLAATNGSGPSSSTDASFRTLPNVPTVVTGGASNIAQNSATITGTANPNSSSTTCVVQYGTTSLLDHQVPATPNPGAGAVPATVTAQLTGLTANTTYSYQLTCTNAGGTASGSTLTFATLPDAPSVSTGSASGISQTAATLVGSVNPNGGATSCHFDYGTTSAYGSTAPCASAPGSGTSAVSVSASLSGLAANTTYHYRLVASNAGGTTNGGDATLTTPPVGCPQDVTKCPVPPRPKITGFSARTMLVRVGCTGFAGQTCIDKLTFKAVVKVRVKHGKKTKLVKKTITVATVSCDVAVGATQSLKVRLTSAAKTALKSAGLTARASGLSGSIRLPKTKVRAKKRH